MSKLSNQQRIVIAKYQYQAAINMCDWEFATRIEKKYPEVKQ
jgi:hypothetical protein